jgi:hypothetical protein
VREAYRNDIFPPRARCCRFLSRSPCNRRSILQPQITIVYQKHVNEPWSWLNLRLRIFLSMFMMASELITDLLRFFLHDSNRERQRAVNTGRTTQFKKEVPRANENF